MATLKIYDGSSWQVVAGQGLNGQGVPGGPGSTWAITAGYAQDRAFNPEATTLTEVARVLGTLIDYLKSTGSLGP